jgi:multiple sugar transport system ATP-binding protein
MIAGLLKKSQVGNPHQRHSRNGVHPSSTRNIAMVFQSYALYPNTRSAEHHFQLEMHHVPKPERDKAMKDVASLLQIELA